MRESTRVNRQKVLEACSEIGGKVSKICEIVGIKRSTFYDWMENAPDFKEAYFSVLDNYNADYREKLKMAALKSKGTKAAIAYLKLSSRKEVRDKAIAIEERLRIINRKHGRRKKSKESEFLP